DLAAPLVLSRGHASAVGALRRAADVSRRGGALPAAARVDLRRRVPLALGPGRRPHRRAGSPARRPLPRLGAVPGRRRESLGRADPVLDLVERRLPPPSLRSRSRGGSRAPPRPRAGRERPRRLGGLPVPLRRRRGLPPVPVGRAASRGGIPLDLPRLVPPPPLRRRGCGLAARALAPALAPVSPVVLLPLGQALARRPELAGCF